jgi:hypothetical protein
MTETSIPSAARTAAAAVPGGRVPARVRVGQVLLTLLLVVCALVAASTAFSDDPFPPAAVVLIASFGLLAAVLGLVVVWSTPRSRVARLAVWALPLFFVWHVAALGTWIPDAGFAVLAAVGALLAGTASGRR